MSVESVPKAAARVPYNVSSDWLGRHHPSLLDAARVCLHV